MFRKKLNKLLVCIVVNIFLIVIVFCVLNIYFCKKDNKENFPIKHFSQYYEKEKADSYNFAGERYHVYSDNPKKSDGKAVIVFGCSFAYGSYLNDNETFEYLLYKKTNRSVYNNGFIGFGIPQMLYLTKRPDFYENIDNNEKPEFAIYIFITDHLRRIYESKYGHIRYYLNYEPSNGKMVEKRPLFLNLNSFYLTRLFMTKTIFYNFMSKENANKNFDLVKAYFVDARRELQKRYPGIKFIIMKYPGKIDYDENHQMLKNDYYLHYIFRTPRWKELEDEGFIILDLTKYIDVNLSDEKYTFPDGHPNAKAWDIITERLVGDIIKPI